VQILRHLEVCSISWQLWRRKSSLSAVSGNVVSSVWNHVLFDPTVEPLVTNYNQMSDSGAACRAPTSAGTQLAMVIVNKQQVVIGILIKIESYTPMILNCRYHGIMVSDMSLKTRCFGQHFCRRKCTGISSTTFTQCAPDAAEFSKITQNKGHFAVQCYSRSPILVSIESLCTTSYYWLKLTYLISCTVSEI